MLHEFVTGNRQELIARCREKAAKRFKSAGVPADADHGVPLFLQQLAETLRLEQSTGVREDYEPAPTPAPSEIARAAALHGADMLRLGHSIDQVVHDYGDVCQSITELALERKVAVTVDEFRTLNRCLDNAIADAVTSFGKARQSLVNGKVETLHELLKSFEDEHQRTVDIAIQAYTAIRTGDIGFTGATGTVLLHSLEALRSLPDRTLPAIRLAFASTTTEV